MMKKNAMSEALHARKSNGLDIAIIIGGGDDKSPEDEQKELGLAPEGSPVDEANEQKILNTAEAGHMGVKQMAADEMPSHHLQPHPQQSLIGDELQNAGLGKGSLAHRALKMMGKK